MTWITPYMIKLWMDNPIQVYQRLKSGTLNTPETELSYEQQFSRLVARLTAGEAGDVLAKMYSIIDAPNRRVKAWTEGASAALNEGRVPILASQLKTAHQMAASARKSQSLAEVQYLEPPTAHVIVSRTGFRDAVGEPDAGEALLYARPNVFTERKAAITIRTVDKIETAPIAVKKTRWSLTAAAAARASGADRAYLVIVEQQEPHCTLTIIVNQDRWDTEIRDAACDISALADGGDTSVVETFRHRMIRE